MPNLANIRVANSSHFESGKVYFFYPVLSDKEIYNLYNSYFF